jgi:hypothetical protein
VNSFIRLQLPCKDLFYEKEEKRFCHQYLLAALKRGWYYSFKTPSSKHQQLLLTIRKEIDSSLQVHSLQCFDAPTIDLANEPPCNLPSTSAIGLPNRHSVTSPCFSSLQHRHSTIVSHITSLGITKSYLYPVCNPRKHGSQFKITALHDAFTQN